MRAILLIKILNKKLVVIVRISIWYKNSRTHIQLNVLNWQRLLKLVDYTCSVSSPIWRTSG